MLHENAFINCFIEDYLDAESCTFYTACAFVGI